MGAKLVDFYQNLRRGSRGGTRVGGLYSVWQVPRRDINVDEAEAAKIYARAAAGHIRAELRAGRSPDGSPLPALTPAALERRRYREAQAARGGAANERYQDTTFRTKAKKHFLGNYDGGGETPRAGGLRGNHSGLLLDSIKIRKRGADRFMLMHTGQRSMDMVLLGRRVWSSAAATSSRVREAKIRIIQNMLGGLKAEVMKAFQNVRELAADVEALGDD